ncbi:FtsX-like permease family protein [Ferrimicrobium sp.]|uniref:FtsX-like permease family protein n=1 Tax=Ferrimicrobium sp. TaxID=2926050 RepID=UPI0026095D34|nr:FtsX-like permease family protein [Ferrimicrobium sp.]
MIFTRIRLFLRGLRFRLGALTFLLIAAVVTIFGATVGPMYLGSAQDSVLIGELRSASVIKTGLKVLSVQAFAKAQLVAAEQRAPILDGRALFNNPIYSAEVPAMVTPPESLRGTLLASAFLERSDSCAHLKLDAGHCPTTRSEVLLSQRTAEYLGVKVGSVLTAAPGLRAPGSPGAAASARYRIVGIYAIPDIASRYWWHEEYFTFGSSFYPVSLDPMIVMPGFFGGKATFDATTNVSTSSYEGVDRELQMSLRPTVINIDNFRQPASVIGRYRDLVASQDGLTASSGLSSEIRTIIATQSSMATLVGIIIVELVLLALVVFGTLIWRMVQSRMMEFRLAQLRGVRAKSIIWRVIGEPLFILVVASPFGYLGAYLTVSVLSHAYFTPGSQLYVPPQTYLAGLIVIVAALIVTLAAAIRALQRSIFESSRSAIRDQGRFRTLTDVLIVAVAAVFTAQLVIAPTTSSGVDPLAGAAPALLGAGLAIIVVSLTRLGLRVARRITRRGRTISWYLSVRQLLHHPGMLRQIIPFGMALALVIFGFGAQSVISRHRSVVAQYEVGDSRVLTVSLPKNLGLVAAVDRADPGGHAAMAAELYRSKNDTTLAVQASRFHAASWPRALDTVSATTIAHRLDPLGNKAFTTNASSLTITARTQGTVPKGVQVELTISLFAQAQETPDILVIPIDGTTTTQRRSIPCAQGGCLLSGLGYLAISNGGVVNPSASFTIAIEHIGGIRNPDGAGVLTSSWKQALKAPTTVLSSQPGRLSFRALPATGGATIALIPASYPTYLPAIVSKTATTTPSSPSVTAIGTKMIDGLDGNPINIRPILFLHALPSVGSDANLVDLTQAELSQSSTSLAANEIWLAQGASPTILTYLRHEGVTVDSVTSARTLSLAYANEPLGLAARLFPVAAVAGISVVLLGLAFELLVEGRGRIPEFAAMRVLGLRRPLLILSYVFEATILVIAAAIAGIAAGLVSARLALPVLPEIDSGFDYLHFAYTLPIANELIAIVLVLLGTLIVATVTAIRVVGRANFDELRAGDR